eukprot:6195310-Pleurochrysis_carterae.AAC.1
MPETFKADGSSKDRGGHFPYLSHHEFNIAASDGKLRTRSSTSSKATLSSLFAERTLNMRRGRLVPKARLGMRHQVDGFMRTGRCQVPSFRCTFESIVFARSRARLRRNLNSQAVALKRSWGCSAGSGDGGKDHAVRETLPAGWS